MTVERSPQPPGRLGALPPTGHITAARASGLPRVGSIPTAVVLRRRAPGSITVPKVTDRVPVPGSRARASEASTALGVNELGRISVDDRVVTKIASRAAAENPDAGGAATRLLGANLPRLDLVGGRTTGLDSLPKTSGEVDGTRAYLNVELSVRYPAPISAVTEAVRRTVIDRVRELAGVDAAEVDIHVRALVTDLPAPPRVK